MATPTLVVLLLTVPVTVLALVLVGRSAARRVRAAYREATGTYERLEASLQRLQEEGEVSQRERERIDERLAQLAAAREQRQGAQRGQVVGARTDPQG